MKIVYYVDPTQINGLWSDHIKNLEDDMIKRRFLDPDEDQVIFVQSSHTCVEVISCQ